MKNNKLIQLVKFYSEVHGSFFPVLILLALMSSCSVSKRITTASDKYLLKDSVIATGHTGISIYEPATGKYWYDHNGDKYFVPASNTKLFTLYAGMKYLGDSLTGIFYKENGDELKVVGNADPSFLHPDFASQPVFDFLKNNTDKKITLFEIRPPYNSAGSFEPYGRGWAWDDYNNSYMAERSFFPIYGNEARFTNEKNIPAVEPSFFSEKMFVLEKNAAAFKVERVRDANTFFVHLSDSLKNNRIIVPFKTGLDGEVLSVEGSLLSDTLHRVVNFGKIVLSSLKNFNRIYSQPSDSLFEPMMHNSDNFFAEQTLLMVSNEKLGFMSDKAIIDTLLADDLNDIPQKPRWVDGCGLSRYNLFTPQSFIYILNKMRNNFGDKRLKSILPTGGEGTLKNYFIADSGFIYAKTGTLSNQYALSGILETKKGKTLLFSVLCNNFQGSTVSVRRKVEEYLQNIREKF